MLHGHTAAVCGECCVLSARSSPHLPQSSVCCVGTQQLFAVSVVYYLAGHSCSLLPQSSVCCVGTQQLFAVSVMYYLSSHSCSCHSHLYAAWSGHTQRLFVVGVVYYLPGHCPTCHSHLYASWSHTAAVGGEYYVLIDCHRVLQTSMGNPWSWGILGRSLCQMMNRGTNRESGKKRQTDC